MSLSSGRKCRAAEAARGGYGGMMFTMSNADAERLNPAAAAGKIVKNH
jgi:hypothetical protein